MARFRMHSPVVRPNARLAPGWGTRRDFLASATALAFSTTAASSLWTKGAAAATPKRGGRFRVGIGNGSTTDQLDPATTISEFMIHLNHGIRNNLCEMSSENKPVGELAESFGQTRGASRWTFNLRTGVEFHNGKTMDADDVVASINYHRGEGSRSAAKTLLKGVEEIRTDGKDRVTFTLSQGNADFPYILADYHFAILPSDGEGNVDWRSGVGTGGYVLRTFEPGVRASLERFPNYWKEGAAYFDEAELLAITDVTARTNALMTGAIDAMDECDLKTVHLLERHPKIEVDEVVSSQHHSAPMNTTLEPFNDNHVRLALKYALDREAYLRTIVRGHGTLGNDHPIAPSMPYYADELPQRAYDPDKARFHLRKAGFDRLAVKLHAGDIFAGAVDAAVLYKEHAARAGIDIDVVREPVDGYWSDVWMKKPWVMVYWGARPTPDMMFSVIYGRESPWNDTHWDHERFNKLLVEARSEVDEAKRRELYAEMQRIVRDEGGSVIPLFNNHVYARRANVHHPGHLSSSRALDGHKAIERWWFA